SERSGEGRLQGPYGARRERDADLQQQVLDRWRVPHAYESFRTGVLRQFPDEAELDERGYGDRAVLRDGPFAYRVLLRHHAEQDAGSAERDARSDAGYHVRADVPAGAEPKVFLI